ncbi:site-specific integrase [Endozoicomonas sp. SESOKO4]|uniref:tyrosine-type recombinase/integrase n=1 Tax=Endozoicomonas sp. SESOKO4 TaxID=2828745 RepID=UPI0021471F2F|nr:site-specific integrase [Endozoicomonas sp. SESOKO4]
MAAARKRYKKDRGNWVGQFPPPGGYQRGRNGIRRVLCSEASIAHLDKEEQSARLWELYEKTADQLKADQAKEEEILKKQKQEKKRMTMRQARDEWKDELTITNDEKTVNLYVRSIDYYLKAAGNHEVRDFDRKKNILFIKYLKKQPGKVDGTTMSAATQSTHVRQLGIFLRWCFAHDIIDKRHELKIPTVPQKDMETYTVEDLSRAKQLILQKMAEYTRTDDVCAITNMYRAFMMASNTLLRLGALWSLPLSAIDMKRRIIRIREVPELGWKPKKMKFPNKPINDQLYDFLKQDLANRSRKEKWFLDKGDGRQWHSDTSNISHYATKIFREVGLPYIKPFHWGFRATMTTHLLNKGIKPQTVQELADHSSLATTMKYFNRRTVDQREATDAIPDI